MSNLKTKAQLLSKLYYSFARWKIWGRFMKNYGFPPLSIAESRVVGEPIVESRVVGEPLKQVGKYISTT